MSLVPREDPKTSPDLSMLTERLELLFGDIRLALLHHPRTQIVRDKNENPVQRLQLGDGSHVDYQELPQGGMDYSISFTLPVGKGIDLLQGANDFQEGLRELDHRVGASITPLHAHDALRFNVFHISKLSGGSNSYTVSGITLPDNNQTLGVSYAYNPQGSQKLTAVVNLDDGVHTDSSQAYYLKGRSFDTVSTQPLLRILDRLDSALEASQGTTNESTRSWDTMVPPRLRNTITPILREVRRITESPIAQRTMNSIAPVMKRVQDCYRHHFGS